MPAFFCPSRSHIWLSNYYFCSVADFFTLSYNISPQLPGSKIVENLWFLVVTCVQNRFSGWDEVAGAYTASLLSIMGNVMPDGKVGRSRWRRSPWQCIDYHHGDLGYQNGCNAFVMCVKFSCRMTKEVAPACLNKLGVKNDEISCL